MPCTCIVMALAGSTIPIKLSLIVTCYWYVNTCVCARAYRDAGGTGGATWAQGKQCKAISVCLEGCVCINVPSQVNCMFRLC